MSTALGGLAVPTCSEYFSLDKKSDLSPVSVSNLGEKSVPGLGRAFHTKSGIYQNVVHRVWRSCVLLVKVLKLQTMHVGLHRYPGVKIFCADLAKGKTCTTNTFF